MFGCGNSSGKKESLPHNFLLIFLGVFLSILIIITFRVLLVPSPEEQIHRLIQKASKVVERHNLPKSLSYVSRDYKDDMGFDYQDLAYLTNQVFQTYPELSVSSKILDITVKKDRVDVDLIAKVLGTIPPDEPEDLLAWRKSDHFLVIFRKEKNKWKVVETKKPPKESK